MSGTARFSTAANSLQRILSAQINDWAAMSIASILAAIKRALSYQDDVTIDHLPINGDNARNYAEKLARARERHGKPFHTSERKPRETEPSHDLEQLNLASAKAKPDATVTKITKERSR